MATIEAPPLALLPSPYEFLDLEDGKSITLSITRGQLGLAEIHPKTPSARHVRQYMTANGLTDPPAAGTPITVPIPVLRVFGQRIDAASPQVYWDISSLTLTADLAPRVNAIRTSPLVVTITAHGYKPHKRFTVEQS
jgi:hypothetical protein